jgi:small subunit ribosomal protein S20
MPNTKSAAKRLRQTKIRQTHNRSIKSAVRTQMRKVRDALKVGETERAEAELALAAKKLDKAAGKRVIHPNTAARLKSRLSKRVKVAKQASP